MQASHRTLLRLSKFLVLLALLLTSISSCQYIPFLKKETPAAKTALPDKTTESRIRKIYIQNFSGQKVKEIQEIFFDAVKEQSYFSFMELLPDDLDQLGVLRIDVTDYNIWEIDEEVTNLKDYPPGAIKPGETIKRRNAIVSLKVQLFEAESGKLRINRQFSQPFQQIYVGSDAIQNRPDSQIELDRLTKMLIFNMLDSFLTTEEKTIALQYEKGLAYDWFAKNVYNMGNSRIRKGIRFAMADELDEAIWVWKIILFAPEKDEPEMIYLHNRASAFYNLGIAYQLKKDWWNAAEMFSYANRIQQKLKYAQAWGNNMQIWLEEQRHPRPEKKAEPIVKAEVKKVDLKEIERPWEAKNLEKNSQLLLQPRILWPLDPILKQQQQKEKANIGEQPTP
ncbi:hypothetical protein KKI24_14575 [bacterium]|nr:hypothetical protein [bacterium]